MRLCILCKFQVLVSKQKMLGYFEERPTRIYCKQVAFANSFPKNTKINFFFFSSRKSQRSSMEVETKLLGDGDK